MKCFITDRYGEVVERFKPTNLQIFGCLFDVVTSTLVSVGLTENTQTR